VPLSANDGMDLYEFGPFRLDLKQRLLLRDDKPIPLQPKAFETLLVLVRNSEKVVLKDELLNAVWTDTFVEESNLTQNIFVLRKALGEEDGRRYIVTVPGRGYRFAEKVLTIPEQEKPAPGSTLIAHVAPNGAGGAALPLRESRFRWLVGLALMVLAFVGFLTWRHFHPKNPPAPGKVMLAVLPFQNLTGDPEQEYFADGLTEEMIMQLGRLRPEQLGVIARTSVMGYKHSDKRLDQIGRELSVQYVLEGSFRRAGDHLRITAQLIQVKDQTHLWSQDYDRRPEDVVTVQDDVAVDVAREIKIRLTPRQQTDLARARPLDPDAYEAYLKGRYFWNKRTEEGFKKAVDYFNQAIAKDPTYAEAYAGLADTYVLLGGYGFMQQEDAMPKAKALGINDQLAEAYTSLGVIAEMYEWNWPEAEKNFKRAIELDPNYSVAHEFYGDGYLSLIGKNEEGIEEIRKAHELDPLSPIIATDLAKRLSLEKKYAEAVTEFKNILDVDPDFVQAQYYLAETYEQMGLYPEAISELKKIKSWEDLPLTLEELGYIYARQGKRHEALQMIAELQRRSTHHYTDSASAARIYIALGDKDSAFVWLQKGYDEHSPHMILIDADSAYDPLRSDPRFQNLVRRIGLPQS
jgi:TolB-like protein/DNA-binding winged helix-turn-helix (wHTH) protein/thioredoxin-like negative regulator of GroEL